MGADFLQASRSRCRLSPDADVEAWGAGVAGAVRIGRKPPLHGVSAEREGGDAADAELFRDLYQECYPHVLAYAISLVGRQVGEDITSETFTIAWRRYSQVQPMRLPWLLGVARNLVYELRRRDVRQYELAAAEGLRISTVVEQSDPAEDVAERLVVLGALATLSDTDRELLTLIAWQGLSVPEAARVLGCSSATLSVRLHRARRRLENAMELPTRKPTRHSRKDPGGPGSPEHPGGTAKAETAPPQPGLLTAMKGVERA